MPSRGLFAVLLFAVTVMSAPQYGNPFTEKATPFPELTCAKCDDSIGGCQPDHVVNEVCQRGTTACMVEMFFTPNSTKMFDFRAGCSARHSCPEGYTRLMCTDFINGVKTCRLCCFKNTCLDPTPGSKMRMSVMKDLMLKSGFQGKSIEEHLSRENEIASNRGITMTTTTTTTTTSAAPTSSSSSSSTTTELCTSTPVSWTSTSILVEEGLDDDDEVALNRSLTTTATTSAASTSPSTTTELYTSAPVSEASEGILKEEGLYEVNNNWMAAEKEEEETPPISPRRRTMLKEANENEEEAKEDSGQYQKSSTDCAEVTDEKVRERPMDSQEMQMNDQTYNGELTTGVVASVYWRTSRDDAMRGGIGTVIKLLISFVAAVAV
ncbi:expressed conserved protein [Echinococcus multilocularis]|uniref:Expressed conserved protein n=1 Tax=Echinococcus multilocularis TaxID=6211 RepID=A0A068Y7D5_ECHMU|nr:expressed conserved protein [Echinococcus multilocularis]